MRNLIGVIDTLEAFTASYGVARGYFADVEQGRTFLRSASAVDVWRMWRAR